MDPKPSKPTNSSSNSTHSRGDDNPGPSTSTNPPTEPSNVDHTQSVATNIRTEIVQLRDEDDANRRRKPSSKFSLRFNSIAGNVSIRIRDSEDAHDTTQEERTTPAVNEINAELTVLYSDNVSYTSSESLIAKDAMGYSLIRLDTAPSAQEVQNSQSATDMTQLQPPPYHVATARDTASVQLTPAAAPPLVLYSAPPLQGAPPTYSALMRVGPQEVSSQICQLFSRRDIQIQPSAPFIAPQPPPSYAQAQGFCVSHPLQFIDAQDYVWGTDPVTIICPYCNNFIVTSIHFRRSNLTHYSALALCICGCWPCCLLPYCMKSCKSVHHVCPICSNVVGIYSPWQVS